MTQSSSSFTIINHRAVFDNGCSGSPSLYLYSVSPRELLEAQLPVKSGTSHFVQNPSFSLCADRRAGGVDIRPASGEKGVV
jgi:hypothetical protein